MSGPSETKAKCPVCGKAPAAKFKPFCSRRCADLDLGRWLKGGYAIEGSPEEAETPDASPGQVPDKEGK
jgi:hypothetical protein